MEGIPHVVSENATERTNLCSLNIYLFSSHMEYIFCIFLYLWLLFCKMGSRMSLTAFLPSKSIEDRALQVCGRQNASLCICDTDLPCKYVSPVVRSVLMWPRDPCFWYESRSCLHAAIVKRDSILMLCSFRTSFFPVSRETGAVLLITLLHCIVPGGGGGMEAPVFSGSFLRVCRTVVVQCSWGYGGGTCLGRACSA